jgi:coproporphyrinogen III oxidase-like Fe-S oxidoreductase
MDPAQVARVIETAKALWTPVDDLEISLEANPTDAETDRFEALAAAGVARLSLGVQALNDQALALLGRNHDAGSARRAIAVAAKAFPRLSADLIYARPGQTVEAWSAELAELLAYGPEHVSPYQLTIEHGTAFDRAVGRGKLVVPDEDLAAALFETTQSVLEAAGFDAYEVSNHARGEAARSRHNLVYWRGHDYVGVGPGAHGPDAAPLYWRRQARHHGPAQDRRLHPRGRAKPESASSAKPLRRWRRPRSACCWACASTTASASPKSPPWACRRTRPR